MEKQELTDRQNEILDFIKNHIDSKGFPPSIDEIMKNFGIKSPTGVTDHLNALARKGHILRHQNISRGIEIINNEEVQQESPESSSIPVLGTIAAGTPILAQENIEYKISIDKSLFGNPTKLFALRVKGDSMINAGIFNGDYAIIHQQPAVERGEIGAVILNDEATLKRVFVERNAVKLAAENDKIRPIIIKKAETNVLIAGKLKGVIRKL
ncbi:MAG: transcriptional repressor LexA [Elusimicrobia bacterium]|nr:transcriptional repressor LexA [Elusimicrobiota bacterium]